MAKVSISGEVSFWIEKMDLTIEDINALPCPTLVTPGAERRTEPLTVEVCDYSPTENSLITFSHMSDSNCEQLRSLIEKRWDNTLRDETALLSEDEEAFVEAICELLNDINDEIGPAISCGPTPKFSASN